MQALALSTRACTLPRTLCSQRLTFLAYFKEAVTESRVESYRIRGILIHYFLADDTVEMHEPEVRNSGMPSGKFLKRMQHPDVTVDALQVGENLTVYGRTFRIYQCDDFTREFYEARGTPQAPNTDLPMDPWSATASTVVRGGPGEHGKKMNALKRYQESRLGALMYKTDSMAKFLKYDKVALTFYAEWEDKRAFGEKHHYKLTYYVATGEVQITEMRDTNAQVIFPLFLKKQRLPRETLVHDDRLSSCEDGDGSQDYYNEDDLRVGSVLKVHKRDFLLYDCDDLTQAWYLEEKGVDQREGRVDVSEPPPVKVELPPPPSTGFGSEEDSLQSWKYLVPKPKKTDLQKLKAAKGHTLKFQAHLMSTRPSDSGRVFRITWYLDDDTIAVYEPPQRNTGVMGGAFARRDKYINSDTGKHFVVSEFFLGAIVEINSHVFEITEADDFSLRHMESSAELWPMSNIEFVMRNLKKKLQDHSRSLRKMFRKFDEDHSQTISLQEFQNMLDYYGMGVSRHELLTIFRAFDKSGTGLIDYGTFCDVFTDRDEVGGVEAVSGEMNLDISAGAMSAAEAAKYEEKAVKADSDIKHQAHLDALLQQVSLALRNSKAATVLYQKFRDFDENKDNTVDRREFRMAMGGCSAHGMFHLSQEDIAILEKEFYPPGVDKLDYNNFISVVTAHADRALRSA